jgi:DNA-binding XRE family transcriptional regulator
MTKFSLDEARKLARKANADLETKVMGDPETKALYERKYREIELALLMREARENKHLSQEDMAKRMHTTKSAVSRLESLGISRHSPSIDTLLKYANAMGYDLRFDLVPLKR